MLELYEYGRAGERKRYRQMSDLSFAHNFQATFRERATNTNSKKVRVTNN